MAQLKYRCPVCKKNLTKREFERAFKIHEAQKEHVKALERNLRKKNDDLGNRRKGSSNRLARQNTAGPAVSWKGRT